MVANTIRKTALFPRKVRGLYTMLARQDGENIYLMYSDMLHFWYDKQLLLRPTFPWEFVQLGNCGSPIETDAGWLVLTHGVGSVRRYAIGAVLLDLNDPGRVIGRLPEPLLEPIPEERDGYVPNVVYSCGALVHAGRQFRLGPLAFWGVIGALAIMVVWTITTATYFAFREDVLTRLIARQAEVLA